MPKNISNNFESSSFGKISLFLPALIILIIVGSVGAYLLSKTKDVVPAPANSATTVKTTNQIPIFKDSLSETYTNNLFQYKVLYPKTWEVDETQDNPFIFLRAENGSNSVVDGTVGVMFITTPLGQMKGAQLSTIVDVTKIQLKNQFPMTDFDREGPVDFSEMPGHLFEFTFTEDNVDFVSRYYMFLGEDNMYVMLMAAKKAEFENNVGTLEDIVESFTLLP